MEQREHEFLGSFVILRKLWRGVNAIEVRQTTEADERGNPEFPGFCRCGRQANKREERGFFGSYPSQRTTQS
jgi:hypothetical protein